jgi:hypothetical protein
MTEKTDTETTTDTAVREKPTNSGTLMKVIAPDYTGPRVLSSIPDDDENALRLAVAAQNFPDFKGDNLGAEFFQMVHWMIEAVEYEDSTTKEVRPGVRVTLFDDAGRTLGSSSEALVRALDTIIRIKGDGPYEPPIRIGITPIVLANGNRSYSVKIG